MGREPPQATKPLSAKEVRKRVSRVLQPGRARYNGQGVAKPSVFLDMGAPDFGEALAATFAEHVAGWAKKDFRKVSKAQEQPTMLWHQRLQAKQQQERGQERGQERQERRPQHAGGGGVAGGSRRQEGGRGKRGGVAPAEAPPRAAKAPKLAVNADARQAAIDAYRAMKARQHAAAAAAGKRR